MYVRKLVKLGENWSDDKQVREFKKKVSDPDYDTEVRIHKGNLSQLIDIVRKRERDLDTLADHQSKNNKRNRRVAFEKDGDEQEKDRSKSRKGNTEITSREKRDPYIPFIPKFLYNSLANKARINIVKWRKIVNRGETMGEKDLVTDDGDEGDTKPPPNKSGKKGLKQRRVTKTRRIGVPDDTVRIKLASTVKDYSVSSSLDRELLSASGYDSDDLSKPDHSMGGDNEGTSTLRALKKTISSIGMSRGSVRHPSYAVIDPGAEKEVVGGVGWRILHFSDKSESLNGPLAGIGSSVLPSVDAVTVVEDSEGKVVLLGIGEASYDRRTTQYESLWNSHHLRSYNVKVDDVAKEAGGDQCMTFKNHEGKDIIVPFKFNGDIMTVDLREPSDEELLTLRVNWLMPPMEELTPQSIRRSKLALQTYDLQVPGEENSVPEEEVVGNSSPV